MSSSSTGQSVETFARGKLEALQRAGRLRTPRATARDGSAQVVRDGRRLLSFSCNDYFGLTHHPAVKRAAIEAIEEFGSGASASYLVTGDHPLYARLEAALAELKGTEAACVFGSGFLANAGTVPSLLSASDLIVLDEAVHASLWAGARLSGAAILRFRHNDPAHARALLREHRGRHRRALIATETVFSMDGDRAPVGDLAALSREFEAWLMTDDAHGLGVFGREAEEGVRPDIPLQMGTLSKALASCGGYLCAARPVVELMHNRARTFVYTTALPPASVAAALAALAVLRGDPALAARPLQKARRFTRAVGIAEAASPIVPIVIGASRAASAAADELERRGFLVVAIRPPTVPEGTARLRLAFTAVHPDEAIDELADAIRPYVA